jgi:hypothetical protein
MRDCLARIAVLMLLVAALCRAQERVSPKPVSGESVKKSTTNSAKKDSSAGGETSAGKLPIRRVVLYKNGVGYFEHLGRVRGDQSIRIDFTSGQLNDVLKSLTILDLSGGRIAAVDYNSDAPLSQRLGELRLPLGEKTTIAEFYGALLGANVEVRGVNGTGAATGRLLSIERKTRTSGGTTLEVDVISLVTNAGEVREVELSPAVSVRLAEQGVHQQVGQYLALLASERDQDLRRMVVSTAGTGERQLYVSYISEVPVWKTTYRLVLPKKERDDPLLQGWAIVDNTVGEDWNDVELSLVAGAPQSFIQRLSQPYYTTRPVVPLPGSVQLTPQTHGGTLTGGFGRVAGTVTDPTGAVIPGSRVNLLTADGGLMATTTTGNVGHYAFDELPAGIYRLHVETTGFQSVDMQNVAVNRSGETKEDFTLNVGTATQTVTVNASAVSVDTASANLAGRPGNVGSGRALGSGRGIGSGSGGGVGFGMGSGAGVAGGMLGGTIADARGRLTSAAQGQDLGDLFEYKLKDRVTIRKNQSALVPIVQTKIAAERVSLWNETLGSPRPLRALWLTNSSSLTLDGGSLSVLEDDTFAGEGLVDPIKPEEKRLVSYATDLGMRVDAKSENEKQRVTRVRLSRGVMTHTSELRERRTYTVRNEDTGARALVIEHPVRAGWKLSSDGPPPDETSADFYRFRLSVPPKSTATLSVTESKPLETTYQITNLSEDQIGFFLKQGSINPKVEEALHRVMEQKARVAALDDEIAKRAHETERIYDDQQRLRENLKALKGSAEEKALAQRYLKQLDDQETLLDTLRRETADSEGKKDRAQADLDATLDDLSLDITL